MLTLPIDEKFAVGKPNGSCGLEFVSFQFQPLALKRASFNMVGEMVRVYRPVQDSAIWL